MIFFGGILAFISMKLYPFKGEALDILKEDIVTLHAEKETDANSNHDLI